MTDSSGGRTARRDFVRTAAGAGGILLLKPDTVFGTQANSAIEVGIIGCGGRGTWLSPFFLEHGARIVALADAFQDRLDPLAQKLQVDSSRRYLGLKGYQQLVASKLDAVAIETPPYFHPEQAAAAVAAGKHVYLAKPVAVDVPGAQSIIESGRRAHGKLSFLADFQTRAQAPFIEAAERVHRGDIGTLVMGHVFYHTGRINPQNKPGDTPSQARLRNWVFDKVLSGDVIVEQHIHVLDVANWYAGNAPERAFGTGGRKARVDVGDCWDHFLATYWYPGDVKVDFSSAQFLKGFHDMCIRFYGSGGTVDAHYGGAVRITGDKPWKGTDKEDTFTLGANGNVRNFLESIRTGKPINNAQQGAESTMTSILGRTAAYRGKMVTWEEMIRANEKLEAKLEI